MENHKTAFTKQSIFLMSLFFLGETYIFTMCLTISSYICCDVHFCNFNSKMWQFFGHAIHVNACMAMEYWLHSESHGMMVLV